MHPIRLYFAALSLGGLAATIVLILGAQDVIDADTFERWYAPAVWGCYNLSFFVIEHEWWMWVLGSVRQAWAWYRAEQL